MGSFKKNGFSTHNNTIASYGCIKNIMQRMVEKIVCIFYTDLWYCVNGIISSTAKSIIPYFFNRNIKTKCKTINNTLIALLRPL